MGNVEFNPMDPEFIEDPYPTYHLLRSEEPVPVWIECPVKQRLR